MPLSAHRAIDITRCGICDMKYCKTRLLVNCRECNYSACNGCYKQFLYSSDVMEIRCMNCFVVFKNQDFFHQMPKRFINENEDRMADILFTKMEHIIPNLEIMKECEIKVREQERIMKQKKNELKELRSRVKGLTYEINGLDVSITIGRNQSFNSVMGEKCIAPKCIGFIDISNEKCRVCSLSVCKRCYLEKKQDHICNEDDIKTKEYVNKNSQKCPNCKIAVSKVDGCDDMFCINCRTKFSYNTGKVITRAIHNPHLTEYISKHGKEINEQLLSECNPIAPPPRELLEFVIKWRQDNRHPYMEFVNDCVSIHYDLSRVVNVCDNFLSADETKRREYNILVDMMISNDFTKKSKRELLLIHRRYKEYQKIRDISETFKQILIDILWKIVDRRLLAEDIENKLDNFYTDMIYRTIEISVLYEVEMSKFGWVSSEIKVRTEHLKNDIIPKLKTNGYFQDYMDKKIKETYFYNTNKALISN